MLGQVAIVLHAHLPFVRHPEHERSLEERWLYEALWESYLPLVDVLDRLAAEGVDAPLTISVSPPLASMLRDRLLLQRFDAHLARLEALASREARRLGDAGALGPVAAFYGERLRSIRATWDAIDGDVLGALAAHAGAGRIELWTTALTHAYLPGLRSPASVRAQLRMGLRAFEALVGRAARGLWLPECAFEPRFAADLAAAGVRYTVVDAHGIDLASPRPPLGVRAPILAPTGVAFFGRDPEASREVWSRQEGFPGHALYRDFYRDIGFDLGEEHLAGELGPHAIRLMTGLKYHRITGPTDQKEPYDPVAASALAREHAERFVAAREEALAASPRLGEAPAIAVAPYDAELFGHWWFEGPTFLEHVLRALDASARAGRVGAITLGGYLERWPEAFVAEPAASSWGEGGYGGVWAGEATARLWRHVHHAERAVLGALGHQRGATGLAGRALDQALRELWLLQASDWAFMIHRGEMAAYAEARVRRHASRAARLAAIAEGTPSDADAAWVMAVAFQDRFLAELRGERLRDAFDPWGPGAAPAARAG